MIAQTAHTTFAIQPMVAMIVSKIRITCLPGLSLVPVRRATLSTSFPPGTGIRRQPPIYRFVKQARRMKMESLKRNPACLARFLCKQYCMIIVDFCQVDYLFCLSSQFGVHVFPQFAHLFTVFPLPRNPVVHFQPRAPVVICVELQRGHFTAVFPFVNISVFA